MQSIFLFIAFIIGITYGLFIKKEAFLGYLNKYIVWLGLPLLIYFSLRKGQASFSAMFIITIVAFFILANLAMYLIISRISIPGKRKAALLFCSVYGNHAYVGIPVLISIFGPVGGTIAAIFSLVSQLTHYSISIFFSNSFVSKKKYKNVAKNPFLWILIFAFLLSRIDLSLPDFIFAASEFSTLAVIFVVGASLSLKSINRESIRLSMLKFTITPLIMIILAILLRTEYFWMLVILSALPSALMNTSMSLELGYDAKFSATITAVSTVIFGILAFIIYLGIHVVKII